MMTTNLLVIAKVKQLRTGGSFRILLPFFQTSWSVGAILNGLRNFGGGGGLNPPGTPLTVTNQIQRP